MDHPPRIAWHLSSCCLVAVFAAGPAGAADTPPEASSDMVESFGLEIGPGGLALDNHMGDGPLRLGGSLVLRAPTLRLGRKLWTTFEAGGGYIAYQTVGFHAFGGTRLGYLVLDGPEDSLNLGLGFGGGALLMIRKDGSDVLTGDGGYGLLVWPTLQYTHRVAEGLTLGATVRLLLPCLIPLNYAGLLSVALDVGFR